MSTIEQIHAYIAEQPEAKRRDLETLHEIITELSPDSRKWFLDGRNAQGKIVTNPNIGYGFTIMEYADGTTRDFYEIGLSANSTGISVYIIGIEDKTFLSRTYGATLGKATITGYCIKFKSLKNIELDVLKEIFRFRFAMDKR